MANKDTIKSNKIYKVTKQSTDGTFLVGDYIVIHDNGTVHMKPANFPQTGWLPKEEWYGIYGRDDFEAIETQN